jgi:hypothetical protein
MSERLQHIAHELERLGEELADEAISALQAALHEGDFAQPANERSITQARRAIEKATRLLRAVATGGDGPLDLDEA